MSDLIDRQAVIDLLKQMRKDGDMVPWEGKDVFARIRKLPTIQPERTEERMETHACDSISRQAAIDAFEDTTFTKNEIRRRLSELPSAQQWIPCSERLPEEYGEYRITWTTSDATSKRFIGDSEYEVTSVWDEERKDFKGEWLLDDYIKAYQDVKVIAWKPLEEPYKGEK